jgi:LysM repeat protein
MNRRRVAATTCLALVLAGTSAACGTTDPASQERLPPIRTTVASTTTTTTTVPPGQRFYTIKPGDTLEVIAASFEVTVESIVALNNLSNPDDIQADQTIEIPSNVVVVTELPGPDVTAAP